MTNFEYTIIGDCWRWDGSIDPTTGYGVKWSHSKRTYAHRLYYERLKGPIPYGLVIDHLCRNRWCVNPNHLEAVTIQMNIKRGYAIKPKPTHCPRGHEYVDSNIYRTRVGGIICKICAKQRSAKSYKLSQTYKGK